MMPALLLAAAGLSCYAGFACFALAMPVHWAQASGQQDDTPSRRRQLQRAGTFLLGLAYMLCVFRDGPGLGSLLWAVSVSASAIAVAFTLTWRPTWLLPSVWRSDLQAEEAV